MSRQQLAKNIGLFLAALIVFFLFIRFLLPIALPFLLAFLLSRATEKSVNMLETRLRMPHWAAAIMCTIIFFLFLGLILVFLCRAVLSEFNRLLSELPLLLRSFSQPLANMRDFLLRLFDKLPDGLGAGLRAGVESLFESGSLLGERAYQFLFSSASALIAFVPELFLFFLTTVLASFMFSVESPGLRAEWARLVSQEWNRRCATAMRSIKTAFGGWLRAQLLLMCVTFVIVTAGLMLLGMDFPFLTGFVIALVDALPIFGTGTVLIPWGLFTFLQGDSARGVGFLLLYAAAALTRTSLEPRLIGNQIGLNPLCTLFFMYSGYKLFGVAGLILLPIGFMLAKQFWDHTRASL